MLVLARKVNEQIVIGSQVLVTVIQLYGHDQKVRLGIDAPTSIPVYRREVYDMLPTKSTTCPCCGR